jgi:hypothetical protein
MSASESGGLGSYVRYCLEKEWAAFRREDIPIALGWRWKREQELRTPLPETFPALAELAALRTPYTTVEDLKGPTEADWATVDELVERGLHRRLATVVVNAIAGLEP